VTAIARQAARPWVLAAAGAIAYLLLDPPSADLAAQEYRAGLGLQIWNNGWYAGHHLPAYSVLFPPLGELLGARLVGAVAAVLAAALFSLLADRHFDEPGARAAALWFAAVVTATLLTGRLTFVLGLALALAALLALRSERHATAAALAALTALASPVAALFAALAVAAYGLARPADRCTHAAAFALAALAPLLALTLLFAEGGSEPFVASAFWPALAGTALVAAVLPANEIALRIGAGLYGVLCVIAFALANPLGGNATRLGALVAGPIVVGALAGRRSLALLAALALPLAYWGLYPAVRDVVRAGGDPSTQAAYHAPLIRFLKSREETFRVEIPFTENHWEARHVAPRIPLARGWERQLDRRHGALFYDGTLNARRYRAWLDEHAVAYVAIPDVALDYAGRGEARLVERGLPYLHQVWHDAHWRVLAVRRPRPLASGAARAVGLTTDGFDLEARRPGATFVRVRHTRWWRVASGRACVERGAEGMTSVHVWHPGVIRIRARLRGPTCRR